MTIHFGDRRDRHYGDLGSANLGGRPAPATDEQLKELVDAISAAAKIVPGSARKAGARSVDVRIDVNGSQYDFRIKSDGTFTAERADGKIEMRLYHDASVYGSPLAFSYVNAAAPEQSGQTMHHAVCDSAKAMARDWYKTATKKTLDI